VVRGWTDWDWAGAEPEFRRALELNPNAANTHAYFAHFLATVRRFDEAIPHSKRAIELDPFNALFHGMYAMVLYGDHRYDDAMAAAHNALAMQPNLGPALHTLRRAIFSKGMRDEWLVLQRKWIAQDNELDSDLVAAFDQGLAEGGLEGAQRRFADTLAAQHEKHGMQPARTVSRRVRWLHRAFRRPSHSGHADIAGRSRAIRSPCEVARKKARRAPADDAKTRHRHVGRRQ
jgi:tetratricopeptide (TPR) repeat protein